MSFKSAGQRAAVMIAEKTKNAGAGPKASPPAMQKDPSKGWATHASPGGRVPLPSTNKMATQMPKDPSRGTPPKKQVNESAGWATHATKSSIGMPTSKGQYHTKQEGFSMGSNSPKDVGNIWHKLLKRG